MLLYNILSRRNIIKIVSGSLKVTNIDEKQVDYDFSSSSFSVLAKYNYFAFFLMLKVIRRSRVNMIKPDLENHDDCSG